MFAVEQHPNEERPWPLQFTDPSRGKCLVDHERGLYFVLLYRRTRSEDKRCLIGDGRIAIPLALRNGKHWGWLLPHTFVNDADKEYWLRAAAEAVLVYGMAGTGLHSPKGAYRVDVNGEHLRLSDFGYTAGRHQPSSDPTRDTVCVSRSS